VNCWICGRDQLPLIRVGICRPLESSFVFLNNSPDERELIPAAALSIASGYLIRLCVLRVFVVKFQFIPRNGNAL
jgi:hypothetical protein